MMDDYEYISNYFKGVLSPEERIQFDRKIQDDPAFAEDVAFYCSSMQEIKDQLAEEKKKRFREIYKEEEVRKENKTPVIFMKRWWSKVAVAAAVVAASMLWWLQPTAMELADKYIKDNFSELRVTMGKNDSMQAAADLHNDGKLKESLLIFEKLADADNSGTSAIKNAGIVSLQLKEYDKALEYFTALEKKSLYSNPGMFYHALTLIKRNQPGDTLKAKQLLQQVVNRDLAEKKTAEEWLRRL
jgi:tetratricopeptide (TPR) repeat protein